VAFSPIPDGQMPSPDDVLARLQPGPGEPSTAFITKEDLQFAWTVFLSGIANGKALAQAVDGALVALTTRVTALESSGGSFTTADTAAALSPIAPNGSIALVTSTGQFFRRSSGAWLPLGLDVAGVNAAIQSLTARVAALEAQP